MTKFSRKRQLGNIGEDVACKFLQRKGFRIVERNYLRPWGEIDIIAEKDNSVRFIEVKSVSREINDYMPEEQVHPKKLEKLSRTAELYMNDKRDERDFQIDVVGVFLDMKTRHAHCRLFEQVL